MERWRDMILHHPQGAVTLDGVGFSAIGRLELIEILGARAEALGATTRFAHPIRHLEELDCDLIVGADGINSLVRRSDEAAFAPHVEHFANYFAWFGTQRRFETLTQTFVRTDNGAFNAHHYRYAPEMSTFIVECTAETFERCRLADMDEAQSARACEEIFAEALDGAPLATNRSQWRRFPRLWCKRWVSGNRVLLNIQTRSDLLNYFLKDSNATLAVCEASLASSFDAETLEGTSVERVVMVNGTDALCGRVPESAFIDGESDELGCADTGSEDMAFWMYSSGSTGRPKGIVHLHHDMAYTHQSFGSHVLRLRADDRSFSVPKIFFAYGFGNSLTFPFSVGATTVLMSGRPEAGAVLDVIERFRPTVFFGLPTLYTALCRVPGIRDRDLGSLRQSMSAAEVLSEETYSSWKAHVGHGPVEGLGSTEMLHIYLSNRLDDHRLGAAGARVPGYEVKLATPEGDPVRPGEEGVMLVRGDSSAPCYWRKPEKSRETMRDDWIDTGDRFVERDGYYYFRGRTDELVKISGQWVWPLEVERCLNEHPHVHECAVLAHELPGRRMTLRAVVRLGDCVEESDATRTLLQQFVKNRLLPFKYPRIVEFVADLPKTGTGKIDRHVLRLSEFGQKR